jgi:thioredoxin-like negative regulator of GroEL
LARDPRQLTLALATSQQAIARARRDGDPRELGVAQAALSPWWREAKAPAPVRLLRATILQSRHEFAAAQTDLDALVADANAPVGMRAQALLTRASLQQLRGRFDSARTDCEALRQPEFVALGHAVERTAKACLIELQSLTGDPRLARLELDALASSSTSDPINGASIDPWLNLLRAELAERLGDDAAAQRHYQAASRGGDVYALAGFTDWLLERGRAREALAVLDGGPEQADALLLRRAIAWQQLGDARAKPTAAKLRERFAAIRMRGDSPHLREEALLALHIDGDATRALALARQQWALQKEPADAVLLWRAASAGADGASSAAGVARELRGWLPDPPRADVRLASMRKSTGGSP